MTITNELRDQILGITGADRSECVAKVAELLNGQIGRHQVCEGSANSIEWDGLMIDLTTKKRKGQQYIKCFYAWEKGDRKTVKMYI